MDFIDRIRELSARIPKQLDYIQTEEATKSALVLPFIAALGYDVFNPLEVTPELNADVGVKKGEKVDYAIMQDGQPIMLLECKHHTAELSLQHASQLYRYFSVTAARFGVLTNGIVYRFYTDLDAPNKMDSKPFFEIDMLSLDERQIEELKKFTKSTFNLDNILTTAAELRYTREIKQIMAQQLQEPSQEFVRFFASQVYPGRMTQQVREQFEQMVKIALRQFINDQLNDRLKSALGEGAPRVAADQAASIEVEAPASDDGESKERSVQTTDEELEAYHIIKALLRETVEAKRIALKDAQTYCAILLDNNNRRPLARLYFGATKKQIGLFDNSRAGERVPLESIDDIYQYADRLKATAAQYVQ